MKIIKIDKNVISGQCYNSLARIQIFYTAFFICVGLMPKGWQGLQFGVFAPAHNPKIGYRCIKFYAKFLTSMPGPVIRWPKWYRWILEQMSTTRCLVKGFV